MATLFGTSAADTLVATSFNPGDFILGLGGNDTLIGGVGRDTLSGNEDNDLIRSRGLGDLFLGGQGDDTLIGESESADNIMFGNKGADLIITSPLGSNAVYGGQGNDTVYGLGNDLSNGDFGDDLIYSTGLSTIFGGGEGATIGVFDGNDTLVGGIGNQVLVGGVGNDLLLFQQIISKVVAGKVVTEGGYGGADIIRNLSAGNLISLRGLTTGDVIDFFAANGDPNNIGVLISLSASTAGSTAIQTITVENVSLNQLVSANNGFLKINDVFVNAASLVPNAGNNGSRIVV